MMISNNPIDVGTLLVANLVHIPFGCSVWPAFWTLDSNTQTDIGGEIDIVSSYLELVLRWALTYS